MLHHLRQLLPKTIADIALVAVLFGLPGIAYVGLHVFSPQKNTGGVAIATSSAERAFDDIRLTAESAVVYDIQSGKIIFAKNPDAVVPLASITKVMTSLVALEQAPKDTQLTFDSDSLAEEGDSGLVVGEKWNLLKLIGFTLVSSSNDGAKAVASAVQALKPDRTFVGRMNDEAATLGLSSMHFENPTGLDVSEAEAGGYGSAADLAKLFAYAIKKHPEMFELTKEDRVAVASNQYIHNASNTNIVTNSLPGLIGSKTGFTDLAGGNLAVIINIGINHPVVLVALGSTSEARFDDIERLAGSTLAYMALEK